MPTMLPTFTSGPDPSFSSSTWIPPFKVRFGVFPGVAAASLAALFLGVLADLSSPLVSALGVLTSALGVFASVLAVSASALGVFASVFAGLASFFGVLPSAFGVFESALGVLTSPFDTTGRLLRQTQKLQKRSF